MPLRKTKIVNNPATPTPNFTVVSENISGGYGATKSSLKSALSTQVTFLYQGKRILASVGLHGQQEFLVVDGVNTHNASKVYPNAAGRILAITKVRLTPGYRLRVAAINVAYGPTQTSVPSMGFYEEDDDLGAFEVDVDIDNGMATASASLWLPLAGSIETYKGIKAGSNGTWDTTYLKHEYISIPELNTEGWVENVTATIQINAYGGARPVDIIVYEIPDDKGVAHNDTTRECTISGYNNVPNNSEYALTGKSYTDEAFGGSHQASKSMLDYKNVCGPVIMQWTAWNEAVNLVTHIEPTPITTTSTSFVNILDTSLTTWSASNPGWSLSCAGTAQNLEQSGDIVELRGKNAVIPVLCRAFMKGGGAGITATVKFQTEVYSQVELTTQSATYVWVEKLAWLKCGTAATDPSNLQIFIKSTSISVTAGIKYACVEYFGNHVVTQ